MAQLKHAELDLLERVEALRDAFEAVFGDLLPEKSPASTALKPGQKKPTVGAPRPTKPARSTTSAHEGYRPSLASLYLGKLPQFREELQEESAFNALSAKLQTVEIDGEIFYVTEGDTLFDEDQLLLYAQQRRKAEESFRAMKAADEGGLGVFPLDSSRRGLLGMTQNGRVVRWAPGTSLSYRVARDSFTSQAKYDLVVENMSKATREWMDTCGVEFLHLAHLDSNPGVAPGDALFVVREIDAGGAFIAAAFFPNDPRNRRRVLIDPSYYTTTFDKVGVLRHELGHTLGFRHEHIRSGAPAVCPGESTDETIELTNYDPQSVMHYFCGEVGSLELRITDLDRTGSQLVYGPPLQSLSLIEA